ncbi:MAG: 2-dehydropantoate 2-reductase, partial [Bacteroidales bacterium]|nr:2-dehydropantoate 2-reductase [Bacteroidales bacterium]
MLGKDLSILVIGAGAIGGITAAFLKKNGYNVEIISKYEDYAALIREQGIEISGISGRFTVTVPSYA